MVELESASWAAIASKPRVRLSFLGLMRMGRLVFWPCRPCGLELGAAGQDRLLELDLPERDGFELDLSSLQADLHIVGFGNRAVFFGFRGGFLEGIFVHSSHIHLGY